MSDMLDTRRWVEAFELRIAVKYLEVRILPESGRIFETSLQAFLIAVRD
jgi:hypothetical protein